MGTNCPTSCAMPIFMDHFERKYISPFLRGHSLTYLRFIEDIFFIWTRTKEQLIRNLVELNTKHDSIKFEYNISQTSISFMDTELEIKNSKLYTKIYRKQTNRQSSLHIDPEYRKSLKHSISCSQTLRIKGNRKASKDFEHYFKEVKQQLHEQGYNSELLGKHIKTVGKLDRNELIKGNKKTRQ